MFKKLLFLVATGWITLAGFSANATFVHHDIYIDNVEVYGAGVNDFGIVDGFSGVIGFLEFDTNNAFFDNIITPLDDPSFFFVINLGSIIFNLLDDIDYPNYSEVQFDFPATYASLMSGIAVFYASLENADGETVIINYDTGFGSNFFGAEDLNGLGFTAELSFINSQVPAPATFALILLSLFAMTMMGRFGRNK